MEKILFSSFFVLFLFLNFAYANNESFDFHEKESFTAAQNNDYKLSLYHIDEALKIDPHNLGLLQNKGGLLALLERYEDALIEINKVLEIQPNHINTLYNKAKILTYIEKNDEAIFVLEKILHLEPQNDLAKELRTELINNKRISVDGYVQIQIRNSQDQLIGYIETDRVNLFDYHQVKDYLYNLPTKKYLTSNNSEFVLIERDNIENFDTLQNPIVYGVSFVFIENDGIETPALMAGHDGIVVSPGDKIYSSWRIILPVESIRE